MIQPSGISDALQAAERIAASVPREIFALVKAFGLIIAVAGSVLAITSGAAVLAISASAPLWIVAPFAIAVICAALVGVVAMWALRSGYSALREMQDEYTAWQSLARQQIVVSALPALPAPAEPQDRRFVYVRNAPPHTDGIDNRDWDYFINEITSGRSHAKGAWIQRTMPSGWKLTTFEDYDRLVKPLETSGLLVGRSQRVSGTLTTTDANEIKAALGLPRQSQYLPVEDTAK